METAKYLSVNEVARQLGVCRASIVRWLGTGCNGVVLQSVKIGTRRKFTAEHVSSFIDELTRRGTAGRAPYGGSLTSISPAQPLTAT